MLTYLFGGYIRTGDIHGHPIGIRFLTRRGAERYGMRGLGTIDPYTKFLTGPIVFWPGKLLRRADV